MNKNLNEGGQVMGRCKVVCVDKKPQDHNKLFGGEYGGFIRIDKIQYKNIKKLYEASESNTWFP